MFFFTLLTMVCMKVYEKCTKSVPKSVAPPVRQRSCGSTIQIDTVLGMSGGRLNSEGVRGPVCLMLSQSRPARIAIAAAVVLADTWPD